MSGPGLAKAGHLSCGDAILVDTILHNDLIGCEGIFWGLVIIGDGDMTLDLNGHTISDLGRVPVITLGFRLI